jgi:hypothetical protein
MADETDTETEPKSDAQELAEKHEREDEEAEKEMEAIADDPPQKLEDWPGGKAKYKTYGGPDGEADYHEGPTKNLGPTDLQYHEDGSVTIEGEEVDDPEKYKGDPIPGGPTDPDAPPEADQPGGDSTDRD